MLLLSNCWIDEIFLPYLRKNYFVFSEIDLNHNVHTHHIITFFICTGGFSTKYLDISSKTYQKMEFCCCFSYKQRCFCHMRHGKTFESLTYFRAPQQLGICNTSRSNLSMKHQYFKKKKKKSIFFLLSLVYTKKRTKNIEVRDIMIPI